MFDIHCHLLPGIDDGPEDMDKSLVMVKMAIENGITHAVVTPHITPGRYENTLESITGCFIDFKEQLSRENINLKLGMAAEVRIDPLITKMVETGRMPFLGNYQGKQVILLEFPHDVIPQGSLEMIDWLAKKNIIALIAHPERNQAIVNNLKLVEPFLQKGCLLQITAASLIGTFGKEPQKTANKLLKNNQVYVIATDAHNTQKRQPDLRSGQLAAEKIIGKDNARKLVVDNPQMLTTCHY